MQLLWNSVMECSREDRWEDRKELFINPFKRNFTPARSTLPSLGLYLSVSVCLVLSFSLTHTYMHARTDTHTHTHTHPSSFSFSLLAKKTNARGLRCICTAAARTLAVRQVTQYMNTYCFVAVTWRKVDNYACNVVKAKAVVIFSEGDDYLVVDFHAIGPWCSMWVWY